MFPKTKHLNGSLIPTFLCIFCGLVVTAENDSGKNVAILMANNKLMKKEGILSIWNCALYCCYRMTPVANIRIILHTSPIK